MIGTVKKNLIKKIDVKLVDNLLKFYLQLKQWSSLGQHEQSQLSAGKFVEIVIRILQYITEGNYTPLNKTVSLDSLSRKLQVLPAKSNPESIRIHIPRTLRTIYDIRNKRGVAHVGDISPNLMDATFVVSSCDWVIAELIRQYFVGDPNEAYKIINSVVEKKVPLIEEFESDLKLLTPKAIVTDKILLILYKKYPKYVSMSDLKKWINKPSSQIYNALSRLNKDAKIFRRDSENIITRLGINHVEQNILGKISSFA